MTIRSKWTNFEKCFRTCPRPWIRICWIFWTTTIDRCCILIITIPVTVRLLSQPPLDLIPHCLSADYNNFRSPRAVNQNFNRRVSWGDQKQFIQNQCDSVPAYDRKYGNSIFNCALNPLNCFNRNFFDNITTTTTMRPPHMGVGSLGTRNRQAKQFRYTKGNSCAAEYMPNNLSTGSMNESKSSYDESIERSTEKSESEWGAKTDDAKSCSEDAENEPEWFTMPVSRSDVIDLRGFDEDDIPNTSGQKGQNDKEPLTKFNSMALDDITNVAKRSDGPPQPAPQAGRPSSFSQYNRNLQSTNLTSQFNQSLPKYRNPLHNSRRKSAIDFT